MTLLRQRLIEDMQLRNFSRHTVEAYVRAVAYFAKRYGRSPDQLSGEQVRQQLLWTVPDAPHPLRSSSAIPQPHPRGPLLLCAPGGKPRQCDARR